MAPGPATEQCPPEQMRWEPKLGGRVQQQQQQQLQGSNKFKPDAKDFHASEFWKQNLFEMGRVRKNLHVNKIFGEAVMPHSR